MNKFVLFLLMIALAGVSSNGFSAVAVSKQYNPEPSRLNSAVSEQQAQAAYEKLRSYPGVVTTYEYARDAVLRSPTGALVLFYGGTAVFLSKLLKGITVSGKFINGMGTLGRYAMWTGGVWLVLLELVNELNAWLNPPQAGAADEFPPDLQKYSRMNRMDAYYAKHVGELLMLPPQQANEIIRQDLAHSQRLSHRLVRLAEKADQ